MNSENTIRKSVQLISVVALIVGASGCATQAGGSKLDQDQQARKVVYNTDTIQVCDQRGTRMFCDTRDRDNFLQDMENLREATRYSDYR